MGEPIVVDIGKALQQLQENSALADMMNRALGNTERYRLARDNDSHWYVIPVARQQEWHEWCEIPSDDEKAWTPPDFAVATGGSFSLVTFTNPEFDA